MLNKNEEAKHAKLREMCRELRVPPPPEIFIGLKVVDKNRVLIFDDVQRGHSWTRNFWNLSYGAQALATGDGTHTFSAGYISGKRIAGVVNGGTRYAQLNTSGYFSDSEFQSGAHFYNSSTTNTKGIVVGTDDTAFSAEQYVMGAIVGAGTGSGQLSHNAMTTDGSSYNSGTKTWSTTWNRMFNNNSDGSITIKEVGLYFYGSICGQGSTFLIERSVLSPTVTVPVGARLTVTYEISMDFSAID